MEAKSESGLTLNHGDRIASPLRLSTCWSKLKTEDGEQVKFLLEE